MHICVYVLSCMWLQVFGYMYVHVPMEAEVHVGHPHMCSVLDTDAASLSVSAHIGCLVSPFAQGILLHFSWICWDYRGPTWPPSFHMDPGNTNFCLCSCTTGALAREPYSQWPMIPPVYEGCAVVAFKTKLLFQRLSP